MGTIELLIVSLIVILDVWTIRQIIKSTSSKNAKYIYVLLVIFLPILGVLLYFLIRYLTNLRNK